MIPRLEPSAATPRTPAILIVEDEPLLMMDAADIVRDAGFRPYEATNAAQAVAILESHDDIVLVFTDIQLAGSVDGLKLARIVRDRWPPIRLLVSSGRVFPRDEDMPTASMFLPKPYRADQLHRMMKDLLDLAHPS